MDIVFMSLLQGPGGSFREDSFISPGGVCQNYLTKLLSGRVTVRAQVL